MAFYYTIIRTLSKILIKVLNHNLIRHAYLDVFENEPLDANNELYKLDNVTITAHITGNDKNIKVMLQNYLRGI